MRRTILVAAIATGLLSCRSLGTSSQPNVDLAARRAELTQTHQAIAARAASGDFIGALSDIIAPEGFYVGALLDQGGGGRGPAASRAFLQRDTLNGTSRGYLTVVRLDVSADGNDGYSYGYLDLVRAKGDTAAGAYKAYWRRGADGKWRALAIGRGRRETGPFTAPAEASQLANGPYKQWAMRDTVAAWATLRATEQAFSDSSRTSIRAAFMSFAAPDGAKVVGKSFVFGREAIGTDFQTPPPGFTGIMWNATHGTVSRSNDLGFNVGPVIARPDSTGKQNPSRGRFFTVWRRQPDGSWRWVVD